MQGPEALERLFYDALLNSPSLTFRHPAIMEEPRKEMLFPEMGRVLALPAVYGNRPSKCARSEGGGGGVGAGCA
jgi:hypothetical protein